MSCIIQNLIWFVCFVLGVFPTKASEFFSKNLGIVHFIFMWINETIYWCSNCCLLAVLKSLPSGLWDIYPEGGD